MQELLKIFQKLVWTLCLAVRVAKAIILKDQQELATKKYYYLPIYLRKTLMIAGIMSTIPLIMVTWHVPRADTVSEIVSKVSQKSIDNTSTNHISRFCHL